MRKHLSFTRRRFLGSLPAIAASIQIVPRHVLGGQGNLSPNEIPTKAVIGVGGMGRGHLKNVNPGSKLVAVCDVDRGHLKTALEQSGPDVKGYADFREVLARKDVDIVHIPTPPHWHALISIAAAEAGKDIWCEKPMTRTIYEGEKVVEAVQRNKRIFRLNTWFRFRSGFYGMGTEVKPIKKLVESGLLGWPLKVTLNQATGFNWKHNWSGRTDLTPSRFLKNWTTISGWDPHPSNPTTRTACTAPSAATGIMMEVVLVTWANTTLIPPNTCSARTTKAPSKSKPTPTRRTMMLSPPGAGFVSNTPMDVKSCSMVKTSSRKPPTSKDRKASFTKDSNRTSPIWRKKLAEFPDPEPQVTDFVEAVRERKQFALNDQNGHRSCTIVNLGKIALRTRRVLRFDNATQRFINDDDANSYIKQPMRGPWVI